MNIFTRWQSKHGYVHQYPIAETGDWRKDEKKTFNIWRDSTMTWMSTWLGLKMSTGRFLTVAVKISILKHNIMVSGSGLPILRAWLMNLTWTMILVKRQCFTGIQLIFRANWRYHWEHFYDFYPAVEFLWWLLKWECVVEYQKNPATIKNSQG